MTYPQFPNVDNCDERLRLLEVSKDQLISKLKRQISTLEAEVTRAKAQAEVRKQVHRDDYMRSGFLIAALKVIGQLRWWQLLRAREIAEQTLREVYGVTAPLAHCAEHQHHHPNCPECVRVGQPAARRVPALTDADLQQRFDDLIASGHNGEDESAEGTPEGTALWARTHGAATSFDLHLQAWEEERSSGVPFDRFLAQRFPTPEARMEFEHRVQQINDRTEQREEET